MLDTFDGIVFETLDHDLLIAQYEVNEYSTSGPTWTVRALQVQCCRFHYCEEPMMVLYDDYATRGGR